MSVASKNLYDLLGNDLEDDTPSGPVKTVDKPIARTTKRNAGDEAPAANDAAQAPTRSRGGFSGSEGAFRDRGVGSGANRLKTTDEGSQAGARGGQGARVRGGRGGRFPRDRDDRHAKSTPHGGSEKQAAQSWGAGEGEAELKDEQLGEEIAKKDEKEASAEDAADQARDETPAEPEDKSVSYSDYLAQLAEKKLALEAENSLKVRQANEGSKQNKQWASAKELVKDETEEFIAGSGGKAKRERERKTKNVVDIDHQFVEPERTRGGGDRGRGGRGRGEGGRGRGEGGRGRGDGFRGGPRGGGRGRGENFRGNDFRGGRGGGGAPRGGSAPRGGQSNAGGSLNPSDEKAFPSLGS